MGEFAKCEGAARDALVIASTSDLLPQAIEAMLVLGSALCWQDRRRDGQRILLQAKSRARRSGLRGLAGRALLNVASSHWQAGNYRLALNYERRSWLLLRNPGQ